jgi:signal transduction histidine kinase/CheY-like chemotaxis protein
VERLTLRTRVALLVAILVAGLALGIGTSLPASLDGVSRGWAESRALGIGRVLAAACSAPLDFEDARAATPLLQALGATRGVVGGVLLTPTGEPLARFGEAPVGKLVGLGPEAAAVLGDRLRVRVPVTTRARTTGALVLELDGAELGERRGETRRIVVGLLLVALLVGIVAAAAVGELTARPLRRMTIVARRIAAGELEARGELERRGGEEPRALAEAFDAMLGKLLAQREEIARHAREIHALNGELEARVLARTSELEEANRALADRLDELRRAQEQLVVADRRVSLGRLSAGVAHEINNPLAYVCSNLGVLRDVLAEVQDALEEQGARAVPRVLAELSDLSDAVRDAREGADRVSTIVKGLKAFSRGDDDAKQPVSVEEALGAAMTMAANEIRHRARLERELVPLPAVEASSVRLSQVFLNLLVNAAQAIPEGNADRHAIRVATRAAGGFVEVLISDSGAGIAPEHRDRVFDPFFTTKPQGVGTGLGLSICHGIVTGLEGTIDFESEVGVGTTFRVRLPASARPVTALPQPAPFRAPRSARVLVVDDDPLVGEALRRALREHEVHVETSGRVALELVRTGERFDRIVCDVMMPEMDGMAFREELARLDPAQAAAIVFMTGGAFGERSTRFVEEQREAVLEKPIDLDRLRRVIDASLVT